MGCCDGNTGKDAVRRTVREGYARIAEGSRSCCARGASAEEAARRLGYGDEELADLPEGANMGLSCGNPAALASLRPGEVVVDLGSGGGFDVFIAARKVGPAGRVIGVDMTPAMLEKARANAAAFRNRTGLDNVEFRLGEIEHLPLADASADVVISNCVINLSPDKPQVWREVARVLKPGGRAAVSDMALKEPLPDALRQSADALVGCVAGAVLIEDSLRMAREAGLTQVEVQTRPAYPDGPADGADAARPAFVGLLPEGTVPSDFIVSMDLAARNGA